MNIDWSEAPEGYPIWITDDDNVIPAAWHREDVDRYVDQNGAYWHKYDSRFTVHRKRDQEWSGTGLPPVGTVCEAMTKEFGDHYGWFKCTVLHVGKDECAIMLDNSLLRWCDDFRPIRTPEQIAAEEKREEIQRIITAMGAKGSIIDADMIAERLYLAGYRKQEQSK